MYGIRFQVGLCMNLRMMSAFSEGHSDSFFPRCYRLSNEEDKMDFIGLFQVFIKQMSLRFNYYRFVVLSLWGGAAKRVLCK